MTERRFIRAFVAFVVLVVGLCGGVNFAVDPYMLFDTASITGFNAAKPASATREHMMKVYQSSRMQAATVVLGSSRTDLGLNPAHDAWPAALRPVYNLSLVGSGLKTGLLYLRHMMASNGQSVPTRTLVVGVDFENFLVKDANPMKKGNAPVARNEETLRLQVLPDGSVNPDRRLRQMKDYAAGLFSLDALIDSIHTVVVNRSAFPPTIEADGHLSEGQMRQWSQADGFAAMFEQKNVQTVRDYSRPFRTLAGKTENSSDDGRDVVLPGLDELFDFARLHGMRVILAVQPTHVSRLDLLDYMGYWPVYEQWMRALTFQVARGTASGIDVSLWDFGGYPRYAQEVVPVGQDVRTQMTWFWDPVHYNAALGDKMVDRMLNPLSKNDFGVLLTPDNLERRLAQVRLDKQNYRLSGTPQVQRDRQLFCRLASCAEVTVPSN